MLKVTANAACKFYVDGEFTGELKLDKILKVNLQKGSYRLSATSTKNKADRWQEDYVVEETNQQKFFEIDMLNVINARSQEAKEGKLENKLEDRKANPVKNIEKEMIKIQGGSMNMGDWGKLYTVNTFFISKYEVTQKQWEAVMGTNPSDNKNCPDCPVEMVSYDDCQTFISKLNALTGKKYRLPTDQEWEFAAKGGKLSKGFRYSGSNFLNAVAWYEDNSGGKLHPVGQLQANELGLYDISGNAWEWIDGWYGEAGSKRNCRGGGYNHGPNDFEIFDRRMQDLDWRGPDLGFSLVLSSR